MAPGSAYVGTFFGPSERQIATLGTGYAANFISAGAPEKAGATLTDKRIYFSGGALTINGGKLTKVREQKIVALRDVKGAEYKMHSQAKYIICAVIVLIAGLGAWGGLNSGIFLGAGILGYVAFTVTYFATRVTLMSIEYVGGNIAYDVRWFQTSEQDIFILSINLIKDKFRSRAAQEQGNIHAEEATTAPRSSSPSSFF